MLRVAHNPHFLFNVSRQMEVVMRLEQQGTVGNNTVTSCVVDTFRHGRHRVAKCKDGNRVLSIFEGRHCDGPWLVDAHDEPRILVFAFWTKYLAAADMFPCKLTVWVRNADAPFLQVEQLPPDAPVMN